jgi:nitrogen fixation/metabolism regulation signal transduction histidine kinase
MRTLRDKLILFFVVATLAPLLITAKISVSLLQRSLSYSSARELDEVSKSLQSTGHELYQHVREELKRDALANKLTPITYRESVRSTWPAPVRELWDSEDDEHFALAGDGGSELLYLVRHGDEIRAYSSSMHGIRMDDLADQFRRAREVVEKSQSHDLRRGFTYTMVLTAAAVWLLSLGAVVYWAHRISLPIKRLTEGLSAVAAGNLEHRVAAHRNDEVGSAIAAFNNMADQLHHSRERLVYVTRLESWQALARKMAHEIKNSLTPIRLTMEEIAARYSPQDRTGFLNQATQIVVDEVTGLERRVRAFTELGSEPPVCPKRIDVNQLLEERIAFLQSSHPEVHYNLRLAHDSPQALADEDLIKGVLTNLLENAAQAGARTVLGITSAEPGRVKIEVHDSGPGLSALAKSTLFEPTISFKRGGMGLGLSIARKSAVLLGGEIELVEGQLGGAGFRVLLPAA